ncbi:hypothetical protein B0I35DRAFT_366008, partial [Stachybotrys elegans]
MVATTPEPEGVASPLKRRRQHEIVLLQEPWTTTRGQRCLTKTHPSFDTFSP